MKNLTIHKIALGVLMACVLAFSVAGVADALTFGTTRTGDLQTVLPEQNNIRVTFSLTNRTPEARTNSVGKRVSTADGTRIDSAGYTVFDATNGREYRTSTEATSAIATYFVSPFSYYTDDGVTPGTVGTQVGVDSNGHVYDSAGARVYIRTVDGGTRQSGVRAVYVGATAAPTDPTPANAAYYNEEAITITLSGTSTAGGGIVQIGSRAVPRTGGALVSTVTLRETEKWSDGTNRLPSGTFSVTIKAPTATGRYEIQITDATVPADYPSDHISSTFDPFVLYVWETEANSRTASITTGLTSSVLNDEEDKPITVTLDASFTRVGFEVYDGPGTLYEDKNGDGNPDSSPRKQVTAFTENQGTTNVAQVYLRSNRGTSKVRAWVHGNNPLSAASGKTTKATYTYKWTSLQRVSGHSPVQIGATDTRLRDPFIVEVRDGGNRPISGETITFAVGSGGGLLAKDPNFPDNLYASNFPTTSTVETDSNGRANVFLTLGTAAGANTVTATYGGETVTFEATAQTASSAASIEVASGNGQRADIDQTLEKPLVVIVKDQNSLPVKDIIVRFTTDSGILSFKSIDPGDAPDTAPSPADTSRRVTVETDETGRASITYNVGDVPGAKHVYATITTYDLETRRATFNINGTGSGGGGDSTRVPPYLSISVSPTRAIAGTSGRVTVNAFNASRASVSNVPVTLSAPGITFSPNPVQSGSSATFTFPSSGTPTITATATNYTTATASITVTPPTEDTTATLTLSPSPLTGGPAATVTLSATVQDRTGSGVQGVGVQFVLSGASGGAVLNSIAITNNSGVASTQIVLPATSGGTVTASATVDGTSLTQTAGITVTGGTGDTGTGTGTGTGDQEDTVSLPSQLSIPGSSNLSGEINRRLAEELRVQVLDANNNGVSAETVFFRITEGRGRLSPARTRTDISGYAEVGFTPQSSGTIEVEVTSGTLDPVTFTITTGEPPAALVLVSGNNQSGRQSERLANPFIVEVVDRNDDPVSGVTVTFAVTAGGGTLSTTTATTNGTGRVQTYLRLGDEPGDNTVVASVSGLTDRVTFEATSGAEVLVSAAQRPPMYWISRTDGKLHRLVDAEVENLAPNIDDILSLTVDTQNQLLYWTRQTAESKSAIQRAGLNGRGVITLQTSLTLMTSLAVDSTGTTLYWADILGKIKSRPVQGNRVTLLAQNLSSPTGLVWANEYLYWGEATGQIRRMNLRNNRRTIETITTSSGEPVSLAVRSGRVYWTEISGNAAQLNRVNTNGTGVEALKTLTGSRRVWIDVDGSDSKIYLTRASKLERRNLSGQSTVTLVTGLESPGSLVLGGELPTSPPVVSQPTQPTQPTQPPVASKYDVNQDGSVNNADTRAVAGAVGQSGAAITNPRTDVDGSGTVDVTDLILVIANLDADVAAPAIDIDVKALDVDFDRVQEQVELLLASGDRSIAAQRALLYLQHLLASARPDETVLLANYPNPFNPETWIPYHLAESTDVRVNIYDAQGTLVRVLVLGHQTAGYYTSRSRAAYWDGLNALGERVASGIYFYQLQTDETSPMRKMVILK